MKNLKGTRVEKETREKLILCIAFYLFSSKYVSSYRINVKCIALEQPFHAVTIDLYLVSRTTRLNNILYLILHIIDTNVVVVYESCVIVSEYKKHIIGCYRYFLYILSRRFMTKREKLFPSFLNDTKHVSFPMIQEMNKKFFKLLCNVCFTLRISFQYLVIFIKIYSF